MKQVLRETDFVCGWLWRHVINPHWRLTQLMHAFNHIVLSNTCDRSDLDAGRILNEKLREFL